MPAEQASSSGMTWLIFAAMTVGSWGLYGILLHTGQIAMADPVNGRYKAFLAGGRGLFIDRRDRFDGCSLVQRCGLVVSHGRVDMVPAGRHRGRNRRIRRASRLRRPGYPCRGDVDRLCRRTYRKRGGVDGRAPARRRIERSELAVRAGDRAGGAGRVSGYALQACVLKPEELSAISLQLSAKSKRRKPYRAT